MGLTAASVLRTATASQRLTTHLQLDRLAERSAEEALRFCESEIDKERSDRIPGLADIEDLPPVPRKDLQWFQAEAWGGSRSTIAQSQSRLHTLTAPTPAGLRPPECLVERIELAFGEEAVLVTARGFSPGYLADPNSGRTLSGSVVWLQSTLYYR